MRSGSDTVLDAVLMFDNSNFKKHVESNDFVLVYFWTKWCVPCKFMATVVEKIALKYNGKLLVGKIDAEKFSEISSKYSIATVPTLMLFQKGAILDCLVGAVGERNLENMLKEYIK